MIERIRFLAIVLAISGSSPEVLAEPRAAEADRRPAIEFEVVSLRRAVEDLAERFGERYPNAQAHLARLHALEPLIRAGDRAAAERFVVLKREALLANPLLDFDGLIVLDRRRGQLGLPTNHQGNSSLPRTGYDNRIAVLSPVRPDGRLRTLCRPSNGEFVGEIALVDVFDNMLPLLVDPQRDFFEGLCQPTKVSVAAARASDASPTGASAQDGWVRVAPREFQGAINNPLKGFRDYKQDGYGLLKRQYIKWNDIENSADDTVERIIAYTDKITSAKGRRFEELNVKLVPRVYLDWDGSPGKQYWPADLDTFDYDSPAFQERLRRLVAKLGQAWDEDPRVFAVQMGLIGRWGEHHSPVPTAAQRRLLAEAFQRAFKHKPVLVRHNDVEFMQAGFGIYYDTFASLSREPPAGPKDQFPWQATHVYRDVWKRAPIEGEVEYNWQKQRESAKPTETFGRTPDETMTVPAYRRYMIDKIRRYHASYLGWIDNYNVSDPEVLAGAAELQRVFGYRFVLDSASYPLAVQPGKKLTVRLTVRNTGSAPFYLDWPVAVALLDPATKKPVWSAPLSGVDIRNWLPGEDWDSAAFAYRRPAAPFHNEGHATLPADIEPGQYIVALALLDRQGGMMPSARFAIENYFRGGWHPLGFIGVGEAPKETALKEMKFDSPAFDDSLHYVVPEKLRR